MGTGVPPPFGEERGLGGGRPFPRNFFSILESRNAYFGAFCGPSEYFLLHRHIRSGRDLEYVGPVWHSRLTVAQSKALVFLQKRALYVIFPVGEYSTNLIIANVETLSHDDSNSHSFSSDSHEFGGHGPLAPSGSGAECNN